MALRQSGIAQNDEAKTGIWRKIPKYLVLVIDSPTRISHNSTLRMERARSRPMSAKGLLGKLARNSRPPAA